MADTNNRNDNICRDGREGPTLTEDERQIEKELVRKIDLLILPLICLLFFLSCIDRSNYAAARLQHLEEDLNLSSSQYQAGLCVFYVGYIIFQVPSNLLMNHFGQPRWHLGLSILAWGLVTGCTTAVSNFEGLVACRIFLGIAEAPVFHLSKWYKKTELTLRISICLAAGLVAHGLGPLIAADISSGLDGVGELSAWQWVYIIEAVVSVLGGIIIVILLLNFPHTWTEAKMKQIAIRRLTLDASEVGLDKTGRKSQINGLKLALADIKLYILATANMSLMGAISCQNFFPTLTATLGYSNIISLLLVAPPYIFAAIYSCLHSYISDRTQHRFWFMIYPGPHRNHGLRRLHDG